MDQLDRMIAFEDGRLDLEQTIQLMQELVDSGLAWQLQGAYGRTASMLIERGLVRYK